MRLLTAIPLLFWASTSAMAHLAVLWACEPAAAAAFTHALSQDQAIDASASADAPAPTALQPIAIEIAPDYPAPTEAAKPRQPESDTTQHARVLAASRLLANPPPAGV